VIFATGFYLVISYYVIVGSIEVVHYNVLLKNLLKPKIRNKASKKQWQNKQKTKLETNKIK
jgi:hypothetical protein